ncbi:MAG: DUF2283 domain-containing protein [Nitrospira sp.]|nr:DUF2283 domain-containing protein [Nitrospira sp.]
MTPIRITYNRKGNVLSVRFSTKKEVVSRESDVGKKEVAYSIAADGSVIGFEILDSLNKRERRPFKTLPVQTRTLMSRSSGRNGTIDHVRYPCHNAGNYGIMEKDSR